jgi:hypothetical protein
MGADRWAEHHLAGNSHDRNERQDERELDHPLTHFVLGRE